MEDGPRIRLLAESSSRPVAGSHEVTIHEMTIGGLNEDESNVLRAALLRGHYWVRCDRDGRLDHVPLYEELPGPVTDDSMLPFWRKPTDGETAQVYLFGLDEKTDASLRRSNPSIYITSLCGYSYSPENYRSEAAKLTEWGFVCMRSPREPDSGQFSEVWFLPGIWFAKGDLKDATLISTAESDGEKLKLALEFLTCNASFGSLDVSIQRIASVLDPE